MRIPEKMNERIRYLRMQHGYTQQEIINVLGVGKSVYSMYERGERNISVEVITKLAKIHNVSTDFIIGLTNNTIEGSFSVDSYLTDKAIRTIVEMGKARDKSALSALNTLLSDRQCYRLFKSLDKVLYMPQHPNVYMREDIFPESYEFERETKMFLKDLFGLSGDISDYSDDIIKKIAIEMGISSKRLTKETRNVAKMLFIAQIENFIERNMLRKAGQMRAGGARFRE